MNTEPSHIIRLAVSVRAAAATLATCVVLAGPGHAAGQVNNAVQNLIPAFYQHQGDNGPAGNPTSSTPSAAILPDGTKVWRPDGGWCAFVSDMDALYSWETLTVAGVHPYDNNNVWLFGAPGAAANPGTGAALTSAGTWLNTADDTVIPSLIGAFGVSTINNYLKQQKVDVGNLGVFGLLDTQYQTLANGQVQVWTIAGWKNVTPNTFQLYQQLTSTGGNLPAAIQPLAAITTTIRIKYTGGNDQTTTGFWWGFHQVAGAGVAGANTIQYDDPDAIPINAQANGVAAAASRNGGDTQAAINNNEYNSAALPNQSAGPVPLPGAGAYTTNNLYSTMQVDALGQVTGGNGPYARGLKGAAAPVSRITNMDAVSLPAAQIANTVVGPAFDTVRFLFSGNFGGDISKLEIFANSPLYAANPGLSENDPNWSISQVMNDPFGNSWASTNGGILLSEGTGGADLMENGTDYMATEDTTGPVTGWTVFAFDQADGYWLTQTYGAGDGFANGPQVVPEPSTWLLMTTGLFGLALLARRRSLLRVLQAAK